MKYPQLVSPRAVNAISAWLVARLDQLGVESPHIYTRLLLSLLQSSVQVNDPIEFSNLEAFFTNRKGGHKRFHLPSDAETLKKLNAVQCLREIVPNELEISTIEELVDELCEKLTDIEKQTQNLSDEERCLIEAHLNTDYVLQSQTNTQIQDQEHPTSSNTNNLHHHIRQHSQHHFHQQQQQVTHNNNLVGSKAINASFNADSKPPHVPSPPSTTSNSLNDVDNDPKKRYFRAFPALSKEMEDSFCIWRRNAKSLTWPIVGRSIAVDNLNNSSASSSSASSIISSSNFGANSTSADKRVEKKLNEVIRRQLGNKQKADISDSVNIGHGDIHQHHQGAVAASGKKKSKRRRNQALYKGKNIQNIRKISVGTTSSSSVGGKNFHQNTHHRNSTPAWDTDFKGCWEMGPDLIKEFISRQNCKKRNQRNCGGGLDKDEHSECEVLTEMRAKNNENTTVQSYIDLSFCYDDDDGFNVHDDTQTQHTEEGVDYVDEDYDDNTLASVSELAMDHFNPKRLYQREGHSQKTLAFGGNALMRSITADNTLGEATDSVDPLDFEQFKAKFTSSVEALWRDIEPTSSNNSQQPSVGTNKLRNPLRGGISSSFYATTSLNALAPFKQDLWNFWSNYQPQNFDHINNKLANTVSTSSMFTTTRLDESSASSGTGADIANSSDYFSMPSNLNDFDKSVGGIRRTNNAGFSLGSHTPSINLFLQNSIWSTSGDCVDAIGTTSAADTDESFLYKVWHSNKKLSELDVGNTSKSDKMPTVVDSNDSVNNADMNKGKGSSTIMVNSLNLGANLQFPPYQNLKWSEGINAGPPYGSLHTHGNGIQHNEMQLLNSNSSLGADNNFASFSSVASISGATWEAPTFGQNVQPDLKSWCASNPISLTEMYGDDVCDSIVNQQAVEEHEQSQSEMAMGPAITLPNHCANTSGFVAYSRIKQCGIVKPQTNPLQNSSSSRLPKDFFRGNEEENLLTSELTHFHPIENFADGYTFDISDALDTIEFGRTSSGLMRYDSEEYLQYTRNDIYMADEEVSTNSTNFLKYGRKATEHKDKKDNFIIKFRVKRRGEKACQTEEQDFQLASTTISDPAASSKAVGSFPSNLDVSNVFNSTFSLSRQANNEAIMAAVTKAVAAAAKAAAENHLNAGHFCWLPITNVNANSTASGANITQWKPDIPICDEVDFCKTDSGGTEQHLPLAHSWSMQEVEKQCHQRRCLSQEQKEEEIKSKFLSKAEVERSEENSLDNTSLHTLWGMCAVCNSCESGKSMPADRLLRDELELEADEIMSDLRYMQDLYIGESDILNEANETVSAEGNEIATDNKMFDYFNKKIDISSMRKPSHMKDINENKDQVQVSMLQKVNQFIEDLLKSENMGKHSKEKIEYAKEIKKTPFGNVWNLHVDQDKAKNPWQFTEEKENNIWQHKPVTEQLEEEIVSKNDTFEKPMKLLKQVRDSPSQDTLHIEKLDWKHDRLAKIWQYSMPTSTQLEETLMKTKCAEMPNDIMNETLPKGKEENFTEGSQKVIEKKNFRNLQNPNELTPSSSSTLNCNSYKRVQQFLNNSAAKMKLAANRKRRHSASQNFYQQQHLHYSDSNNSKNVNNNNNDNITDLNAYKIEIKHANKTCNEEQQQQKQHQQEVTVDNNSPTRCGNLNLEEQPTKHTIITCKYWTASTNGTQSSLNTAAAAMMLLAAATNVNNANDVLTAASNDNFDREDLMLDENVFGNTFSCLIDKNSSILKHVTMMTRPLTR